MALFPHMSTLFNSLNFANQFRRGLQPGNQPGFVPYEDLARNVNAFMTEQARAPFLANLPNYEAMTGQASSNALQQLQGDVPNDVLNQIIQQAAQRGISTGSPGGPNANAAYLRALGLTSLDMQKTGMENYKSLIEATPVPQIWNPMSLYVPEQLGRMGLGAAIAGSKGAERLRPYATSMYNPPPVTMGGTFSPGVRPTNFVDPRAISPSRLPYPTDADMNAAAYDMWPDVEPEYDYPAEFGPAYDNDFYLYPNNGTGGLFPSEYYQ